MKHLQNESNKRNKADEDLCRAMQASDAKRGETQKTRHENSERILIYRRCNGLVSCLQSNRFTVTEGCYLQIHTNNFISKFENWNAVPKGLIHSKPSKKGREIKAFDK